VWSLIPDELKALFFRTAPAFAAEVSAARWSEIDLAALRRFPGPVLLTKGEVSPAWLPALVDRLAELLPEAETATIPAAGHGPHETHPEEYAKLLADFGARAEAAHPEAREVLLAAR
jgi:pimeloyl-ACP methyl ester carboxylesterase